MNRHRSSMVRLADRLALSCRRRGEAMSGATRGQPRLTIFAVLGAITALRERRSDYLSRARRSANDGSFAALSFAAKVPRSLVQELFAVGTPDEVIEQIAEFRDHGLSSLVVGNAGWIGRPNVE